MPKSTTGSRRSSVPNARAVARAADAGSARPQRRPEDGQRGVAGEFVDQPVMFVDRVDDDPEKVVEHLGNLLRWAAFRELRRTHQVDEQNGRFDHVSGQRRTLLNGAMRDVRSDVAPEQVVQPVPFGEPGDHPVESRLQAPDLGTFVRPDVRSRCGRVRLPPSRRRPRRPDPKWIATSESSSAAREAALPATPPTRAHPTMRTSESATRTSEERRESQPPRWEVRCTRTTAEPIARTHPAPPAEARGPAWRHP